MFHSGTKTERNGEQDGASSQTRHHPGAASRARGGFTQVVPARHVRPAPRRRRATSVAHQHHGGGHVPGQPVHLRGSRLGARSIPLGSVGDHQRHPDPALPLPDGDASQQGAGGHAVHAEVRLRGDVHHRARQRLQRPRRCDPAHLPRWTVRQQRHPTDQPHGTQVDPGDGPGGWYLPHGRSDHRVHGAAHQGLDSRRCARNVDVVVPDQPAGN